MRITNNLKVSLGVYQRLCVEDTSQTYLKAELLWQTKIFLFTLLFFKFPWRHRSGNFFYYLSRSLWVYSKSIEKMVPLQFFLHDFVRQDKQECRTICPKPVTLKGFKDESSQLQPRTKLVLALWKEESSRSTILSSYFSEGLRQKHYLEVTELVLQ